MATAYIDDHSIPKSSLRIQKLCWSLAPLLVPPRHWCEQTKMGRVTVARRLKKWRGGNESKKMTLIRAISAPQILHENFNRMQILGR